MIREQSARISIRLLIDPCNFINALQAPLFTLHVYRLHDNTSRTQEWQRIGAKSNRILTTSHPGPHTVVLLVAHRQVFWQGDEKIGANRLCPRDGRLGCALVDWLPPEHRHMQTHFMPLEWRGPWWLPQAVGLQYIESQYKGQLSGGTYK